VAALVAGNELMPQTFLLRWTTTDSTCAGSQKQSRCGSSSTSSWPWVTSRQMAVLLVLLAKTLVW